MQKFVDSREKILQAAEDIFAAKGLAGARVNEIAGRAGINKRMLYHYFGNKDNLYEAVLKRNLEKIMRIEDIFMTPGDPVQQVTEAVTRYFYFLADNSNFVRLMEWEFLQGSRFLSRLYPRYNIYGLPAVEEVYRRGAAEGIFRSDVDPANLVLSINAMCFIYFSRASALKPVWNGDMLSPENLEKRLQHILQVVFRSILVDPGSF